jgi:hypothetical protein
MEFAVIKKRSKPLLKELPPILGNQIVWDFPSIAIPKKLPRKANYFAIEVLPADQIDRAEFHGLPSDSLAIVGILASSFFPIWVRAISDRTVTVGEESASAYNNFPFPDLSKSQNKLLEEKVGKVFKARSILSFNKLSDIYSGQVLPEYLLIAHEDLDEALLGIFGLPLEANNAEILEVLMKRFVDLSK